MELSEREREIATAIRKDWGGRTLIRDGLAWTVPPVQEGGRTAELIDVAVRAAYQAALVDCGQSGDDPVWDAEHDPTGQVVATLGTSFCRVPVSPVALTDEQYLYTCAEAAVIGLLHQMEISRG